VNILSGPAAWALAVFAVLAAVNEVHALHLSFVASDAWVKLVHLSVGGFAPGIFFPVWVRHCRDLLCAAFLLLGAWGHGAGTGRWIRRRAVPLGEAWLHDLGLGLGGCALAALGAGLAGLYLPAVAWTVALTGLVRLLVAEKDRFVFGWAELRAGIPVESGEARALWAALAVMGGTCLLMALGPEVGWDPAYYHLRLPKLYALVHKIYFVPMIYPSHYPQLIEMLYGLGWLLAGEGGARLVNAAFWPLCALAVFRLSRLLPEASRGDGLRVVAVTMTIPLLGTLASENYIDLGLTFLELLALRAAWRGRLGEAAIVLGLAMGAKYTAVLAAVAVATALLATGATGIMGAAQMALIAAVPVLPWLIRNALFTGDPVAPFLYARLGRLDWADGISQTAMAEVIPKLLPVTWAQRGRALLTGPWEFLNAGSFAVYTPFVFALAPALVWRWRGAGGFLKVFVLTGTALTLVVSPDGRYWQPYALPLAVLAVVAWRRIAETGHRVLKAVVPAVAYGSIALGAGYHLLDMHRMFTSYGVALGFEPQEVYFARVRVPSPWYALTANWINGTTPRGERVAVVSDVQAYMLNRDAFFDCDAPGSRRWIWRLPQLRRDEADLNRQFRQWNVRTVWHIRTKAIAVSGGEVWTPSAVRVWARWWSRRARLMLQRGDCAVYTLGSAGPAAVPLDLPGPQDALLRELLTDGLTRAGRQAVFRKALALGADSAYLRAVYGNQAVGDGAVAEGIAQLRAAARLAPGYAAVWFSLARGLIKARAYSEARAALATGLALGPTTEDTADIARALDQRAEPKP